MIKNNYLFFDFYCKYLYKHLITNLYSYNNCNNKFINESIILSLIDTNILLDVILIKKYEKYGCIVNQFDEIFLLLLKKELSALNLYHLNEKILNKYDDAVSLANNINKFSKTDQIKYVKNYPWLIGYIYYKDEDVCNVAIESNPFVIQYISTADINYNLIMKAVKKNGLCIKYIEFTVKTRENINIQMEAIKNNPESFNFIKNPFYKVKNAALKLKPTLRIFI